MIRWLVSVVVLLTYDEPTENVKRFEVRSWPAHWTLRPSSDMRRQFATLVSRRFEMKICHYNNNQAGVVVGDQVYDIGDALIKAGLARQGYTMLEIIDALANNPAALQIARDASQRGGPVALNSVKLLAPIANPGAQGQRSTGARYCLRLHDLLGHQPARSLGQGHAKHPQHSQGLRHFYRSG